MKSRPGTSAELPPVAQKANLIEELSRVNGVSLGQAYLIARKQIGQTPEELPVLNEGLGQLIFEQTRGWRRTHRFGPPGIAHVLGIVGVAEAQHIPLAEAAKIAIEENRGNEHWEAIAWAIKFLGQEIE